MKFTIQETSELVVLEGDVGGTLCRIFHGVAENGARVRLAIAHTAVSTDSPNWETVKELFDRLDVEASERAHAGQFLMLSTSAETVETKPPIEA